MSTSNVGSNHVQKWLDLVCTGDLAARDELLRGVCRPLERLAKKMLRRFPRVHRWADTDDVLQNALLRLFRALKEIHPESPRAFFGLASEQLRRECLDLARHYYGPLGLGTNDAGKNSHLGMRGAAAYAPDKADELDDLEKWTAFHEEVALLPALEREIVGLVFYHGWKKTQVAELLQITVRTVQRHWESAMALLHRRLKARDMCPAEKALA